MRTSGRGEEGKKCARLARRGQRHFRSQPDDTQLAQKRELEILRHAQLRGEMICGAHNTRGVTLTTTVSLHTAQQGQSAADRVTRRRKPAANMFLQKK